MKISKVAVCVYGCIYQLNSKEMCLKASSGIFFVIFKLIYMCLFCLHVCMCIPCVPGAAVGQRRASGPLEWE